MAFDARNLAVLAPPKTKAARCERRSKRVKLSLPVRVQGQTASGEPFRELTHTLSLSAHGGLVLLGVKLQKEQTIVVENVRTGGQQECRVAYVSHPQNGKRPVGIEFKQTATSFWQIHFPTIDPSLDSSTRRVPKGGSTSTPIRNISTLRNAPAIKRLSPE